MPQRFGVGAGGPTCILKEFWGSDWYYLIYTTHLTGQPYYGNDTSLTSEDRAIPEGTPLIHRFFPPSRE